MKRLLLYLCLSACFIFLTRICYAQDASLNTQKTAGTTVPEDTTEVNRLIQESKQYLDTLPDVAIRYATQARDLAEKIRYTRGLANALKYTGIAYFNQSKYEEAIRIFQQSQAIFESMGDKIGVASILNNMGATYVTMGDKVKALEYYFKSLKAAEDIGDKLRIATVLQNIGAFYLDQKGTLDRSLEYLMRALPIAEELKDNYAIGTVSVNLGEVYLLKGNEDKALHYFQKSMNAYQNSEDITYSLNSIGKVYYKNQDYASAFKFHQQALDIAKKSDAKPDIILSLQGMGDVKMMLQQPKEAISYYKEALTLASSINDGKQLRDVYKGLSNAYAALADYSSAYKYQYLLTQIKDTLYNIETDKKLSSLQYDFDIQKKQGQIDLLTKDKAIQDLDLKKQKIAKNSLMAGMVLVLIIAFIMFRNYRIKVKTNRILDGQKAQIENLLLNILPSEVAGELQRKGYATPRYYESASVLFTDFKSFTRIADGLSPHDLVAELNSCFMAFDEIIEKHNLEKIKTIGDSYMCAGGIPVSTEGHVFNMIKAGIDIIEFIKKRNTAKRALGMPEWDLRIGIHIGPIVAGVVGKKKYAYDIWGSTVNIASRMESNGEPGQINISSAVYELVKDQYDCIYRGKISAKNIGEIDMYFIDHPSKALPAAVQLVNSESSEA